MQAQPESHSILWWDLGIRSHKIMLIPDDQRQCCEFIKNGQKFVFSDEAHFWISGNMNKQYCGYWGDYNREIFDQASMLTRRLTV